MQLYPIYLPIPLQLRDNEILQQFLIKNMLNISHTYVSFLSICLLIDVPRKQNANRVGYFCLGTWDMGGCAMLVGAALHSYV